MIPEFPKWEEVGIFLDVSLGSFEGQKVNEMIRGLFKEWLKINSRLKARFGRV